jgi:acyl-CoA thioesterase-2
MIDSDMTPIAHPLRGSHTILEQAVLASFDGLLDALAFEPLGDDRFRFDNSEPNRFGRLFGGQLVAQSMMAASATVADKPPNSLHAYFVEAGVPAQPLELIVDRVRDGRSMATRRVSVTQRGRTLVIAMVSFHSNPSEPELAEPAAVGPGPDSIPLLQDWVALTPPDLRRTAGNWVNKPPPLEMRIGEAPCFLGGARAEGPRSLWMRLPRDVGDDAVLHRVLLTYASDYLLLDMALRSHPDLITATPFIGFSLDHALWLHRPVRFDCWHVYTQRLVALSGDRGLVRGEIRDESGHLVATSSQEVLIRLG